MYQSLNTYVHIYLNNMGKSKGLKTYNIDTDVSEKFDKKVKKNDRSKTISKLMSDYSKGTKKRNYF